MKWEDLKSGDVLHYVLHGQEKESYLVLETGSFISDTQIVIKYLSLDTGSVIEDVRGAAHVISQAAFTLEERP